MHKAFVEMGFAEGDSPWLWGQSLGCLLALLLSMLPSHASVSYQIPDFHCSFSAIHLEMQLFVYCFCSLWRRK